MKYDIFRVVYVSGDNIVTLPYDYNVQMMENEEESGHGHVVIQNWEYHICYKDLYILVYFSC